MFYFAKKYADVPGTYLSGTRFEKGWYIPSIAENVLVYELHFFSGDWHGREKKYHSLACAIREF
ncbi:MAG: hypothetical protein K6E51_03550 [Treponema sp.]|nr:hypothetical protein [Treponema sp.]